MRRHQGNQDWELLAETRSTSFRGTQQRGQTRVPSLTILCHPDADRVGEEAPLHQLVSGSWVGLSRLEPRFAAPVGGEPRALAVVHLSRKPMILRAGDEAGSVVLERGASRTRLTVEGEPAEADRGFSAAELERGVTLVLSRRIALLLHWLEPVPADGPRYGLVGESAAIRKLRQEIRLVADLDVPVLLRGETGTGKELVARAIHEASRRRDESCVTLNIGAVPPSLAAAELFGAARGAYTGADRKKTGFFERANRGTLFLDEIGETPPELQVLLLRALENHEIQPVGGVETRRVDVRVIAATDADLETASAEGRFRAPLLHRLAGYELRLPALRERRADVARLLFHFLRQELADLSDTGMGEDPLSVADSFPWPPAELVARLARYDWPGNVRQLRNVARRLAIARQAGPDVDLEPIVDELLKDSSTPASHPSRRASDREPEPETATAPSTAASTPKTRKPARSYRPPHEVSDDELIATLKANGWRLKPTATKLGVSRSSLYVLIDRCPRIRRASELGLEEIAASRQRHDGDLDAMAGELEVSRYGLQRRMRELEVGRSESS